MSLNDDSAFQPRIVRQAVIVNPQLRAVLSAFVNFDCDG